MISLVLILKNLNKENLRRSFLAKRLSYSKNSLNKLNKIIINNLLSDSYLQSCKHICGYQPFKNEVDITVLYEILLKKNINLYFPKIIKNSINLVQIKSLKTDFSDGYCCIKEPKENHFVNPNVIECFLVPGIVFDVRGFRLGFGKGFYDQLLHGVDAVKYGIAYKFQIIKYLSNDTWDIKLNKIFSEELLTPH